MNPLRLFFLKSVVLVLAATALVKFLTVLGEQKMLALADPLFPALTNRHVLSVAVVLELVVVAAVIKIKLPEHKLLVVAWFASLLFMYRWGIWSSGIAKPCPCMGSLGDWTGFTSETIDKVSLSLLIYLFFGSMGLLFHSIVTPRGSSLTNASA